MNTIFKKPCLSILLSIVLSLILFAAFPILYTGQLSQLLLKTCSMNLSLIISALLLILSYYFKYRKKDINPMISNVCISLFSLSIGLIFLNIVQIPMMYRLGLWIISLGFLAYYFKNVVVNLFLTIAFLISFSAYIFNYSPMALLTVLPTSIVRLNIIITSMLLLFVSNIPYISRNYSKFSFTYKIFSIFMILNTLLAIFIDITGGRNSDLFMNEELFNQNLPSLLLLSVVPIALALLSFTSYLINKKRLSYYLKLEVCLSILLSIVMIFIINFTNNYITLILTGLSFALILIAGYYIAYKFKNSCILVFMNTMILTFLLTIAEMFKIYELPIYIPIASYILSAIALNLPVKRLNTYI